MDRELRQRQPQIYVCEFTKNTAIDIGYNIHKTENLKFVEKEAPIPQPFKRSFKIWTSQKWVSPGTEVLCQIIASYLFS